MATFAGFARPWRRAAAGALVLACASIPACRDTPTEPAAAPTATPPPVPSATATPVPSATPSPTSTPTPTATPTLAPPVAFTWITPCSPLSEPRMLTAQACGCVMEPMTISLNGGTPDAFACDGTRALGFDDVVTISTARWSVTQRFTVPFFDPHCGITARLVCR